MQILNKQQMYRSVSIFSPKSLYFLLDFIVTLQLQQKFKIVSRVFHRSLLSSLSLFNII